MVRLYEKCTFCPRLCRHTCPVALATGREAATPTALMTAVWLAEQGRMDPALAGRATALCTSCQACQVHCKDHVPVPSLLASARGRLLPAPAVERPGAPEGDGSLVAVECDERRWSEAASRHLGAPVARLVTSDHLGALLEDWHPDWEEHCRAWSRLLQGRTALTACQRCARVLQAARVPHALVHEHLSLAWTYPTCATHPTWAQAAALERFHPEATLQLARATTATLPPGTVVVTDASVRRHLLAAGAPVLDPIDILLKG